MAKVITKSGVCSTRKKAMGFQFMDVQGGKFALSGSYSATGEIVASPEVLPADLTVSPTYKGCKLCGNKYAYVCPNCGGIACCDGNAHAAETCPSCGSTLSIPAASGTNLPKPTVTRKTRARTEKVQLEQGEVVRIVSSDDQPLSRIEVHVMWDMSLAGASMDVDSSVIVSGSSHELIYFGNKTHGSGCVIHHGDNLTGGDDGERISVYLDKVPYDRDALYFVLNIYKCDERRQTLRNVRNMSIVICDPDSGQELIEYKVGSDFGYNSTALVLGKAYRSGGEWLFKAIGTGTTDTDVHSFADNVVRRF